GVIKTGKTGKLNVITGELITGEILSPVIIKKIFSNMPDNEISIIDAPPGTSCPVVQSVINSDKCVLVTEPTPFGLYDLKLAVELLRKLKKEFSIVINKFENENNIIREYCNNENIKISGRIPFDKNIAAKYSAGEILIEDSKYKQIFSEILEKIL
nr:P-loop NTPase [bacterium]